MIIQPGQAAPDFSTHDDQGHVVRLSDLKGKTAILFFYPKDDTPGCTKESCEFRDFHQAFKDKGAVIYGVSADDSKSHQAFRSKYDLNFPLLADTDKSLCRAFGVWGPQEWQGKTYEGIARTTFVIGPDSKVTRVYEKVNPVGHAQQVLKELV